MNKEKRELYYSVGNLFIKMIQYFSLIFCVFNAGLTFVLLLLSLINGGDLDPNVVTSIGSYITHISSSEINDLILSHSITNVEVSFIGYGVGMAITYFIIYYISKQFLIVYRDICIGDMYKKKNAAIINECTELSFLLTFAMPIIILTINFVTGVFSNYSLVDFSGIVFLLSFLLLKLIFANGIQLQSVINNYQSMEVDKEIARDEAKMESVKTRKKAAVKKTEVKKEQPKKTTKSTTKKTTKK